MIERYTRPEMSALWSDQARYAVWLEVELAALESLAAAGLADKSCVAICRERARIDVDRINALESEVKHDVIAFLTAVNESIGPESRFIHRGMTSSDLVDSAFAISLVRSGKQLSARLQKLRTIVLKRAEEFRKTPCVGRSHGIHAEPTTFGLKIIGWYAELTRQHLRLKDAIKEIAVGKIAGAVGTYAALPASVELEVLKRLGLRPETVSTQVVARDRHAFYFSVLAGIAGSLERIALEVRHLQRSEVREAEEYFSPGQKGSSAMPHKRNPILTENVCGLARLMRGYSQAAAENVALWHERDISHSSVERVVAPDACTTLDFMLYRMTAVVEGLVVYPERMLENLNLTRGLVFSGSLLVLLVDSGMTREHAYKTVQTHALAALDDRNSADLMTRVLADTSILKHLNEKKIRDVFDLKSHLSSVDLIFERAIKEGRDADASIGAA